MGRGDEILSGFMGHMTKMAAMSIYDKTPSKLIFSSGTNGQVTLWLGF